MFWRNGNRGGAARAGTSDDLEHERLHPRIRVGNGVRPEPRAFLDRAPFLLPLQLREDVTEAAAVKHLVAHGEDGVAALARDARQLVKPQSRRVAYGKNTGREEGAKI